MLHPFLRSSALLAAAVLAGHASAQSTERVSLSTSGAEANQFSRRASISGDGRLVAFESVATNLVPADTNNQDDVFLHDRASGATTRISVATGGAQANGFSSVPRLSGDGCCVAFESGASNLVSDDTNSAIDIFLRDIQSGATTRVSVANGGAQANGASYAPALSADGRYVAFHSAASNLVAGDSNNAWDVFVHDRQTGATVRASVTSAGAQVGASSSSASLSADGRYVAFHSGAPNLVAGDSNGAWDVFVHDNQTGATTRVSLASNGAQGNASSVNASISGDATRIAFHSAASNLISGDMNLREDVFVHDRLNGTTERASVSTFGFEGDGTSRLASLSSDGRFVAFESLASNLDPADTNVAWDVFVHDLGTGATLRASVDSSGVEGDGTSSGAAISSDGWLVAFDSYASALVDGDTNNNGDVFVRDGGVPAPTTFCTAGTTSSGCVPSISYSGAPSATAAAGFIITVAAVEGQRQGLLFYGLDNSGFVPDPWGSSTSFLCVKSPTQRTLAHGSGGNVGECNGVLSIEWNAFMATHPGALGNPLQPGQTIFVQGWFRDPASPKTTMLSDALAAIVGP